MVGINFYLHSEDGLISRCYASGGVVRKSIELEGNIGAFIRYWTFKIVKKYVKKFVLDMWNVEVHTIQWITPIILAKCMA